MPRPSSQTLESVGVKVATQGAKFFQQGLGIRVGEGEVRHVHDRLLKTRLQEQIAPIVHVHPRMMRRRPTLRLVQSPNFLKAVRTQTGKHHKTIGSKRLRPLAHSLQRIGRHVQLHVAPHHVHCLVDACGLHRLRGSSQPNPPLPPRRLQGLLASSKQPRVCFKKQSLGIGPSRRDVWQSSPTTPTG